MCTHYCELCHWLSVTVVNKLLHPFNSLFSTTTWVSDCEVTTLWQYTTHTHTHLTAHCPELPGWAGTRKVKPVWILLQQVTVSGSGISWAICKSAPRSRQITMPASVRPILRTRCVTASANTIYRFACFRRCRVIGLSGRLKHMVRVDRM